MSAIKIIIVELICIMVITEIKLSPCLGKEK